MMFGKVSDEVRVLCDSMIENYQDWYGTQYELIRRGGDVRIWISNGPKLVGVNGLRHLSSADRRAIYRAATAVTMKNAARKIDKETE